MTTSRRFWPTPEAGAFGTTDVERLLERRERYKAKGYNGNGFGLTTHQAVMVEEAGYLATGQSTSSPAGSPASPGVPRDDAKERQMTAISGRNLRELWDSSDPVGVFLRMCRESSVWRPALTGCSLTWKRSATPRGRSFSRLRLSAPTTAATGSGSSDMWATPRVEGFDAGKHRGKADSLHSQVKDQPRLWTTPNAEPATGYMSGADADTWHLSLEWQAKLAPEGPPMVIKAGESPLAERGERPGAEKLKALSEQAGTTGMKLSAAWVTALMGYPEGWLDDLPSDPIGKPTSPASRSTSKTASTS